MKIIDIILSLIVALLILLGVVASPARAGYNPNQGTVTSVGVGGGNTVFNFGLGGTSKAPILNAVLNTAPPYSSLVNGTNAYAVPAYGFIPMLGGGTGAALTPSNGALFVSGASVASLLVPGNKYQDLSVNSSGVPAYAFGLKGFQTLSATTTLTINSPSYNAIAPGSSAATITLPAAASCLGKIFIFEQVSGSGVVNLVPNGSDSIEGSSSIGLLTGVSQVYISDGSSVWRSAGGGVTFNGIAPSTVAGGLIIGTGTNTYGNLPIGLPYQDLGNTGTGIGYLYGLHGFQALTTATTLTTSSPSYNTITPSAALTISLPGASTCKGKIFIIEQVASVGTYAVTIAANSGDTIEGQTTQTITSTSPYGYISDGSGTWRAISAASASFNQLAPNGNTGAIIAAIANNSYGVMAPNTSTTRKFVISQGTGSAGQLPFTDVIGLADLPTGAGGALSGASQSASFTAVASTSYPIALTSANITCTLPDATTCAGQLIEISIQSTAAGTPYGLGFATTSSQTIDGLTAANFPGMNDQFARIVFRSEAGNWRVVSRS